MLERREKILGLCCLPVAWTNPNSWRNWMARRGLAPSRVGIHEIDITVAAMKKELTAHLHRLEEKNCRSFTPLMAAAMYGNVNVVRYLLSCGADVEASDTVPLFFFFQIWCWRIGVNIFSVDILHSWKQHFRVKLKLWHFFKPLELMWRRRILWLSLSLEWSNFFNSNISIFLFQNDCGALMFVAWQGHQNILSFLLSVGANVDVRDKVCETWCFGL